MNEQITYFGTDIPVVIPEETTHLKQEFRAVWVATVHNIDVPLFESKKQFQAYFLEILDTVESYNMNAIIFQIRPKCDAFYPLKLNPWSRWLSGKEGKDPGWDPLKWMIDETHKRHIEFHAWFNPYMIYHDELDVKNYGYQHPEYVLTPDVMGFRFLNPGEPKVQEFIIDTIMEVAENYDIDAVHFDDYFYPYGGLDNKKDQETYLKYNPDKLSQDDWRRANVDKIIFGVKKKLTEINKKENRVIQFGISPFGIWANKSTNPLGSNTGSTVQIYYEMFSDVRKWVKKEWIDYVVPQVYWQLSFPPAPYADVVDWWVDQVKNTKVNLYIGQGIFQVNKPWKAKYEICDQLLYNSKISEIKGVVQFNYSSLKTSNDIVQYTHERIRNYFYKYRVLPPVIKNIEYTKPNPPKNLKITKNDEHYILTFTKDNDVKAYYIYRFDVNKTPDLNDISNVVGIAYPTDSENITFIDSSSIINQSYQYYVTAFNKINEESNPSTFMITR